MVGDVRFRRRNVGILKEAQEALNIAFGAILSAYIGNSLAEIDDAPFDHWRLARFFLLIALFIAGLCVGNSMLLRGYFRLGAAIMAVGLAAAVFAHADGHRLGFEVTILRLISGCWAAALLLGDAILTLVNYLHHRNGS